MDRGPRIGVTEGVSLSNLKLLEGVATAPSELALQRAGLLDCLHRFISV